jgi:cytidylate kinase
MQSVHITIDGPAASGKSTAAKILAHKLNFLYIDTGAMYRAVTLLGIRNGISFEDEKQIIDTAKTAEIEIKQDWSTERGFRVFIGDEDITNSLFFPEIDNYVSIVARIPQVRTILVEAQRKLAVGRNVIMAGRDIGSNVLTDAQIKIFLTASAQIRAERRLKELKDKGINEDYNKILKNIEERDLIDSTRKDSPLVKAKNAVEVDCTNLTIDEMVQVIENTVNETIKQQKK